VFSSLRDYLLQLSLLAAKILEQIRGIVPG
jgi:hypothetical protein